MRNRYRRYGSAVLVSLAVALALLAAVSSPVLAVTIKPAGANIQLKATGIKLHIWGLKENNEYTVCEEWQMAGKISAFGTLPLSLEKPIFGNGKSECSIEYALSKSPATVSSSQAPELNASSKTAATISHAGFTLQVTTKRALEKHECSLQVGYGESYGGTWNNGTSKEKPSTLTFTNAPVFVNDGGIPCYIWAETIVQSYMTATFTVTDTTEPNKVVVLE